MTTSLILREGELPKAFNGGLFISSGYGRHPRRTVDNFEIIFMRSGRLIMREGEETFKLESNDALLLFPDREHVGLSDYEADTSFYWIHFHLADGQYRMGEESVSTGDIRVPQFSTPERPERLIDLYRQFLHGQEEGFGCNMEAALLMAQVLVELACHRQLPLQSRSAHRLAEQVKKIIHSEFYRPELSPGGVAERLEVNPDYLGRVFKRVTGQSLGGFIIQKRLRESRKLLQESELNVNQIALAVGFNDPGYFRRLFRKHFDMKPADLRKLYYRVHVNVR